MRICFEGVARAAASGAHLRSAMAVGLVALVLAAGLPQARCPNDPNCEEVVATGKKIKYRANLGSGGNGNLTNSNTVNYGIAYNQHSFGPPPPDSDATKVIRCAAQAGESVFDEAGRLGNVSVSYSAAMTDPWGRSVFGTAEWLGAAFM